MFSFKKKVDRLAPSAPAFDPRKELIREEMQFLLQRDQRRFRQQLRARLLEEGCNLPMCLAYPLFCHHLQEGLKPILQPQQTTSSAAATPTSADLNLFLPDLVPHAQFYGAMRTYASRLQQAEQQMALSVQEALGRVIAGWRLPAHILTRDPALFSQHLNRALALIAKANPGGAIAGRISTLNADEESDFASNPIVRRIHMAMTTGALRHTRRPELFFVRFGTVPGLLAAIQADPACFCRAMHFFSAQVPYFSHVAAQSFWRTLGVLDLEPIRNEGKPEHTPT